MGLRDEVAQHNRQPGSKCAVGQLIAVFPTNEVDELVELIDDMTVTAASLARVLTAREYKIAQASITRHRRKECSCGTV